MLAAFILLIAQASTATIIPLGIEPFHCHQGKNPIINLVDPTQADLFLGQQPTRLVIKGYNAHIVNLPLSSAIIVETPHGHHCYTEPSSEFTVQHGFKIHLVSLPSGEAAPLIMHLRLKDHEVLPTLTGYQGSVHISTQITDVAVEAEGAPEIEMKVRKRSNASGKVKAQVQPPPAPPNAISQAGSSEPPLAGRLFVAFLYATIFFACWNLKNGPLILVIVLPVFFLLRWLC